MQDLLFIAIASAVGIASWKWMPAAWVSGALLFGAGLFMIIEDQRRHDEYFDGVETILGVIVLICAVVAIILGLVGKRVRRAER